MRKTTRFALIMLVVSFVFLTGNSRSSAAFENKSSFTLSAVGDIMMHEEQSAGGLQADGSYNFDEYFAFLGGRLSHSDVAIANMETPIVPGRAPGGFPYFNSPAELAVVTALAGIDIVSASNNHSLDQEIDGAKETLRQLLAAGIEPVGMYEDKSEYFNPYVREINGINVAFLAYTEHINGRERHFKKGELDGLIKIFNKDEAAYDILRAKRGGADVVVIMIHWGKEYENQPSTATIKLAEELAVTGADIIIGSHPHVVQPCEIKTVTRSDGREHDVFIAYSLGNFISNQTLTPRQYGVIVDLDIEYDFEQRLMTIKEAGYSPTMVWKRNSAVNRGQSNYSVVACDDFVTLPAEGMTEADMRHIARANKHIMSQMEQSNVPLFDYYARTGLPRPDADPDSDTAEPDAHNLP